jgi:hypothetical protein
MIYSMVVIVLLCASKNDKVLLLFIIYYGYMKWDTLCLDLFTHKHVQLLNIIYHIKITTN